MIVQTKNIIHAPVPPAGRTDAGFRSASKVGGNIKDVDKRSFTWKIGGEAGFGIMSTGETFARLCMRAGLNVFSYPEYPSLIRGGHNTIQVTASPDPVSAHGTTPQILIALNRATLELHLNEMSRDGIIIYDTTDLTFTDWQEKNVRRKDVQLLGFPLEDLTRAAGGQKLMRNTVALGVSCALLDIPSAHLDEVLSDAFKRKGKEIVALNSAIVMAGYNAVSAEQKKNSKWRIKSVKQKTPQVMFTGNDALAMGALQAGVQLFSAYPMTPASSILHFIAEHGPAHGVVVRHAEDEIAAIHHAIGAAYTGVRAMTATAGGGFALMTEAVGMAAMTEVGIVIVEAQRGGPSTGLPTWTEQGDLRQVLHASQGDFPRIVLAPSSHLECFTMIQEAFHLADQYQTPVIVMTDKYLAEGLRNVSVGDLKAKKIIRGKIISKVAPQPDGAWPRYRTDVADGVAPRTLPGTENGLFLANSDEHDKFGYSNEDIPVRVAQMERRARKIDDLKKHLPPPRLVGPNKAPLTIVTWGSTAGSVEAALQILEKQYGQKANVLIVTMIAPLPVTEIQKKLKGAKRTVIVEANQNGQLAGWVREQTGCTFKHAINRIDGRPFDPAELAKKFANLIKQ